MSLAMLVDQAVSPPASASPEAAASSSSPSPPNLQHVSLEGSSSVEARVPRRMPNLETNSPHSVPTQCFGSRMSKPSQSNGGANVESDPEEVEEQGEAQSCLYAGRAASTEPNAERPQSRQSTPEPSVSHTHNPAALRLPPMRTVLTMNKVPITQAPMRHHSSPHMKAAAIYKDGEETPRAAQSGPRRNNCMPQGSSNSGASQRAPSPQSYPPYRDSVSTSSAQHSRSFSMPALHQQQSQREHPQTSSSLPSGHLPRHDQRARSSVPSLPPQASTSRLQRPQGSTSAAQQSSSSSSNSLDGTNPRLMRQIQEEVQQSFESLAAELGRIDELSLSLHPARGGAVTVRRPGALSTSVTKEELIHRRSVALNLLNELHARCSAMDFTIWCPSEKSIAMFHQHTEEDLSSLQREIAALEERRRPYDQLLFLRRKLLAQRYYWRCRLNNVEK